MATKVDIAETSLTATQLKLFFDIAATPGLHVNRETFQAYLEKREPFPKVSAQPVTTPPPGINTNLLEWFQSQDGLDFYDYESFKKRILLSARDDADPDISSCESFDLKRGMSWQEIVRECLGGMEEAKQNAMTPKQLQAYLHGQWTGKSGALLVNWYTNIFPILGGDGVLFAVLARRSGDGWRLHGWAPSWHDRWSAGDRVFRNKY